MEGTNTVRIALQYEEVGQHHHRDIFMASGEQVPSSELCVPVE